jgi:hypothetical protein
MAGGRLLRGQWLEGTMAGGSNVWEGAMTAIGDDWRIVKGWLQVDIYF